MLAIFIAHTSSRLYHAHFPPEYLRQIHDTGHCEQGITLTSTQLYDFCDVVERSEWLDILIALTEHLRSGDRKLDI
jgi:hypothetical protein